MKEVLRFERVEMRYHTKTSETVAVKDLSFSVSEGEFLAVVGPSGCGKTTLLSLAAGLLKPSSGKVISSGVTFGYMLQKDELFPWRTIEKNAFLPLEIKKIDNAENRAKVIALAEKYGLKDFLKSYPAELSGGMRQRAALIRTLASNPDVLLLDEPFSALDYQTRLAVSGDISQIIRREHKTALLVTHDISEAISLSDRIVVLSHRPATVKAIHDLGALRTVPPLERRSRPEFQALFNQIWEELDVNV